MLNIIIPCYKAKDTLSHALDSLVTQTYKMFFVTISQDGDDEDYSEIIETYRARGLHINLIKGENKGPGVARQRGIDNCDKCDYLMFLDADDILNPRAVEVMYKEAKKGLVDILVSDFIGELKHGSRYFEGNTTPVTWMHNKIYRTAYLKNNNIRFRDDLRLNEDSYFNLVAANCTDKKGYIKEYTYIWRHNSDSLTRSQETEDFFHRSWIQYIQSQVCGIEKIIEITDSINNQTLAATIINIYSHTMRAIHFKEDLEPALELIHRLRDNQVVQDITNERDFWIYIYNNVKICGLVDDDNMFFFKERFIDWFTSHIKKTS